MGLSSCCAVVSHDKSNGTLPPPDSAELPLPAPLPVAAAAALSFFDFLSKLSARDARGARGRPAGPAFLDRTGESRRVHPSPLAAQGRPPTRKQARGVAPSFLSQVRGPLEVPCGPRSANAPT